MYQMLPWSSRKQRVNNNFGKQSASERASLSWQRPKCPSKKKRPPVASSTEWAKTTWILVAKSKAIPSRHLAAHRIQLKNLTKSRTFWRLCRRQTKSTWIRPNHSTIWEFAVWQKQRKKRTTIVTAFSVNQRKLPLSASTVTPSIGRTNRPQGSVNIQISPKMSNQAAFLHSLLTSQQMSKILSRASLICWVYSRRTKTCQIKRVLESM